MPDKKERLFMAANRVGKTVCGAYESALHLTGLYPDWWDGAQFDDATDGWASGKTTETTRDIVQLALCGPPERMGTGMIPGPFARADFRGRAAMHDQPDRIFSERVFALGLRIFRQFQSVEMLREQIQILSMRSSKRLDGERRVVAPR